MKVSVIMPVYNAGRYLRQCMDSLISQTLHNIEIICVDDGSTDDSVAILEEYARKDSRVRIICQSNSGAGAARNNGMQYAVGEYLSILDCDDFFEPDMLKKSYTAAQENNLDIIVFGCDFYYEDTQEFRPCNHSIQRNLLPQKDIFNAQDVTKDIFRLFVGWSWDKLFRTDFVRENNMLFQEQRTTNDALFVFNGILRAKRIGILDEPLAHYRQSSGSLSVTREKSWMCFYNALMALREEMYKIGCYDRFEQDYKNYCVHFSLWNLNTLKEPTHTLLYNKLRDEWFAEMGVLDHPSEYFYNQHEYKSFRNVYDHPVDWEKANLSFENDPNAGIVTKLIGYLKAYGIRYTIRKILNKILFLITGKELLP